MRSSAKAVLAAMATALIISLGSPSGSRAQVSTVERFDLNALHGICGDVRAGNSRFNAKILRAARVLPSDTDGELRSKVAALFAAAMPLCDGFNLRDGSILKYAVAARTYEFLFNAANSWDVDLNRIDASDGRTVIDYLDNEISKNLGRPAESELQSYRDILVRAGARTTAQLEAGEDCRPSTRCRVGSR